MKNPPPRDVDLISEIPPESPLLPLALNALAAELPAFAAMAVFLFTAGKLTGLWP